MFFHFNFNQELVCGPSFTFSYNFVFLGLTYVIPMGIMGKHYYQIEPTPIAFIIQATATLSLDETCGEEVASCSG